MARMLTIQRTATVPYLKGITLDVPVPGSKVDSSSELVLGSAMQPGKPVRHHWPFGFNRQSSNEFRLID